MRVLFVLSNEHVESWLKCIHSGEHWGFQTSWRAEACGGWYFLLKRPVSENCM